MERRLAAILQTDMVGYSRLMGLDEEGTIARQKACRDKVFDPKILQHGGRIVKSTGDGLLVEFPSAIDSVKCAVELQKELADHDTDVPKEERLQYRIGINLGDIVIDGDDILGDGVNVAARLESLARPGGVCISGTVYDQLAGKLDLAFEDAGEQTVKNVPRPVRVWHWKAEETERRLHIFGEPPLLPDKPSIAVLPFDNMSGDPEQAYFADGIAEDLITGLSRVSWFFVISRNSSFAFRGEKHDVRNICRKLGVRYLVEGSVRRAGSRIRVTAQLVDGLSGNHLWADKYDGALDEIFDLQDSVTENLIGAIEPKLRSAEIARAQRQRPESLSAFDLLLQALPHHWAMTQKGFDAAIKLLDSAVEIAPTYAEALGYAAACRALRPLHNCSPDPVIDFREADELSQRAFEADPVDPVVLRSTALIAVMVRRDYETALDLIDRSLAVDQNGALAWGYRGWTNVWAGKQDEAITDFDRALRLSPYDQWISTYTLGRAFALLMSSRFDDGLRWARRAMQDNANWTACYRGLVGALVLNGNLEEARTVAAKLVEIDPTFSVQRWVETGPFLCTDGQETFFAALRAAGLPD